jgi:hypothetical protein
MTGDMVTRYAAVVVLDLVLAVIAAGFIAGMVETARLYRKASKSGALKHWGGPL